MLGRKSILSIGLVLCVVDELFLFLYIFFLRDVVIIIKKNTLILFCIFERHQTRTGSLLVFES